MDAPTVDHRITDVEPLGRPPDSVPPLRLPLLEERRYALVGVFLEQVVHHHLLGYVVGGGAVQLDLPVEGGLAYGQGLGAGGGYLAGQGGYVGVEFGVGDYAVDEANLQGLGRPGWACR